MNKFLYFLFFITTFITAANCQKTTKSSNTNTIAIILLLSANKSSTSCIVNSNSPKFSTLASAGTANTTIPGCSSSGCHTTADKSGNMDISNYDSVMKKVVPGNTSQSILYNVVQPGGKMNPYTNSQISATIKAWIEGCASR
jgi:hypothetical protein